MTMRPTERLRLDDLAPSETPVARMKGTPRPERGTRPSDALISSVWSFDGRGGDQVYRWYGTLPRPLVERLLGLYCPPGTRVLDPFVGLGATLDAAADAGLQAHGLDVNPLACLAARVRLFTGGASAAAVSRARVVVAGLRLRRAPEGCAPWAAALRDENLDYARKWFRADTLGALLRLLFAIADEEDAAVARVHLVAAAQIIREVASVDPRCTHHLVTKQKPFIDPLPLWLEQVAQVVRAVRPNAADPRRVVVQQASALECPGELPPAGFVLIHPPYLGVINYHLIHRLATDLLGIVQQVRAPEALAGLDFGHERLRATDMSTDRTETYQRSVERLADAMAGATAADARCVVIIGDQRHKGHLRHPFTDYISAFESRGFLLEENFIWLLQNNGGMHVLRRGHFIDHNYILVFNRIPATPPPRRKSSKGCGAT
jgi:hypothetical protein